MAEIKQILKPNNYKLSVFLLVSIFLGLLGLPSNFIEINQVAVTPDLDNSNDITRTSLLPFKLILNIIFWYLASAIGVYGYERWKE